MTSLWLLLSILIVEYLGLASQIGILKAIKFTLLSSLILFVILGAKSGFSVLISFLQTRMLLVLIFLSGLSIPFALLRHNALEEFTTEVGQFILMANIFWVLTTKRRIQFFTWAFAICLVYLIITNLGSFFSPARAGQFTAGYFLGDGNDFGWCLVTFFPLTMLALQESKKMIYRLAALGASCFFLFGILGTSSRGASLGLAAIIGYMVLTAKKRATLISVVVLLLIGVLLFAPSSYLDRMSTIGDIGSDNSAQGRFRAWRAAVYMALDHPLGVGAGNFNSVYGRFYRDKVVTQQSWGNARWISPHSIYFLTLGEHGFPGLILLLLILYTTCKANWRYGRQVLEMTEDPPVPRFYFKALNLCLTGYAVGGMFLGGLNYPHLYILLGMSIAGYYLMSPKNEGRKTGLGTRARRRRVTASKAPKSPDVSPAAT